jgi:hypothetical protein
LTCFRRRRRRCRRCCCCCCRCRRCHYLVFDVKQTKIIEIKTTILTKF